MTGYKSATVTSFSQLNWYDSEFHYVILAPMLDLRIPNGFLYRPLLLFGTWRFSITSSSSG